MDHEGRFQRLRSKMDEQELEALLVTNLTNVRYLTGFSGTNGHVLITEKRRIFLSDPRYEARASTLVEGAEIVIYPSRITDVLVPILEETRTNTLGVEAKTMTVDARDDLAARLEDVEPVPTVDLVEELRRVKEPAEAELIRQAVALGDRAFARVLERLAPGSTESEIALDLEVTMRGSGAEAVSFPPIVGSGPLSAHIHHTPSERELQKGDLVLLDFGCIYRGYCSDLTRTVVLGPATEEQRQTYDLVLEAQRVGIRALAAGVRGQDVDAQARDVIAGAGSGEFFGHGLGHGVGLDIHEAPRLHRISEDTLVEGDVVTVEPGIYRPGDGGVRVEDCVLVTQNGAEVLGSAPKDELIEL